MRKQFFMSLVLLVAAAFSILLVTPQEAMAQNCACLDDDNDGTCGDAGDILVNDADLLAGPIVDLAKSFVIPASCNIVLTTNPGGGVRVTAKRIVIFGSFTSTPNGGKGVLFTAVDDVVVDGGTLVSGGTNELSTNLAGNEAIAKASVGLKAGTTCTLNDATLRSTDGTLLSSGKVGIKCEGDIEIHGSTILAAIVNIQSDQGLIDASCVADGGGGGACPANGAGLDCDDPVKNLAGGAGPPGNNNGVLDAGDFPCDISFPNIASICNFCEPVPPITCNVIKALNGWATVISKGNLLLQSPAAPATPNLVAGQYGVNLVAEDGDVDSSNSTINNQPTANPPSANAKIFVFADPDSVNRLPVDKEKSFATAPSGTIEIDGACYGPKIPVRIGEGSNVIGPPAAPPCAQFPADFTEVTSGGQ